jgi:hypothetical protein
MPASTKPTSSDLKLDNPYKFRAYRSGSQSTAANAQTIILFNNKDFDTGSNFNTSLGRFVAPVAGLYQFNAAVSVATTAAAMIAAVSLYKNGASKSIGTVNYYTSATGTWTGVVSDLLQLAANDYIEVDVYFNAIAAITAGTDQTYFSGQLLSLT